MGPFGYLTKLGAKRVSKCKSLCHEVALEFFATKAPDPPHWTLNSCFGVFRTIWVHLGPLCCHMKLGSKRFEQVQKFVPRSRVRIFRNEPTRSTPLDPKLMFGAFHTIWVHLRPFDCLTKLGAKRFELVQKFVKRRRVGAFRYERTRSSALDPKHMFWTISYHLRSFETVRLPYETRCKTGRTSAKVCATKLHWNFSQRTHPIQPHWTLISCFGAFHTIWVHLGPLCCHMKLGAKRAELVQKFVPRSRVRIFRNEPTRSTPLDPKLMFWCISCHLGTFATIRLPYKTRGKTF